MLEQRDKALALYNPQRALFTSDAIGLVDTSQQPVGFAPVVEDVCPPMSRPNRCRTDAPAGENQYLTGRSSAKLGPGSPASRAPEKRRRRPPF
jgi:hypothetical protein